jgi:plastocyanin
MKRFQMMTLYMTAVALVLGIAIGVTSWVRSRDGSAPAASATTAAPATTVTPGAAGVAAHESRVRIEEFAFVPRELTIPAGTRVTWVNQDDVPHTATSSDAPPAFDSRTLDTDGVYSFTFTKSGTYRYYCKVHPRMTATVIVK